MDIEERKLIEASTISYIKNAEMNLHAGDYQRAAAFLDIAVNQVNILAKHNKFNCPASCRQCDNRVDETPCPDIPFTDPAPVTKAQQDYRAARMNEPLA